ncbi:hypothetical protein XB02_07270 [Pantoea ananatis]|nr:hypothetical protein XB02_07270 [Pantoea ananatis]
MAKFCIKSYIFTYRKLKIFLLYFVIQIMWQSGSRAQRYVPLFITIRPKENIKISKLIIFLISSWDL